MATPLIHGALRELHEELRLSAEAGILATCRSHLYLTLGGSTSKHVAIVYQWTAASDDVDIVLSGTEFFERRGNFLKR